MQISRLFETIYLLMDKKCVTAKELAERFEVSTRTVYRDIEILSAAGIPVYMTKGKGGGISLLPDFVLNKTVLTENERNDILCSLKALGTVTPRETDTALQKLGSLFGESNTDWIEIDFSSWGDYRWQSQLFEQIKSAIIGKSIVEFSYFSAKGQRTQRRVEPIKLCYKGGAWYLYGYCRERQDFRFFKLSRMKKFVLPGEHFTRVVKDRILEGDKNDFCDEFVTLKLKISGKAAYRVFDEFDTYEETEEGDFVAVIHFPKGEWLFYYLITFGQDCEILEPEYMRDELKEKLLGIAKIYS